MTVGEMNERMPNVEFIEWQVYFTRRRQREEKAMRQAKSKRS